MSLAIYRKYRPKKMEEVLGQETNIRILKNAAKTNRFSHAYLFYGPRGTGKTTTARLIAKLLNCKKRREDVKFREEGEPCNKCNVCQEIDANNYLDVIEIDAASNRGIDEIRNLKESIKIAPVDGGFKIYIIDEVHMLTGPAFNALLKTLEEPPAHSVLILATTEYEKLPATIVSRTQRFLFKKLPKIKILEKLEMIAKAEGIKIEKAALELLATTAEGSLRDAESLLDQISSLEDKITLEDVERLTGRLGTKKVERLTEMILKNDIKSSLNYISLINEEGYNLVQLTKELIHYLRKILSIKVSPLVEEYLRSDLTEEELEKVKKLAELIKVEKTIALIKSLIRAYSEMKYSPFSNVPLEIALIENLK